MIWERGEYCLTDDRDSIDLAEIIRGLRLTNWAATRPEHVIRSAWNNSALPFAMFRAIPGGPSKLVGFARVVSDLNIQAYLADVFIFPEFRKNGLALWMLECIFAHPKLQTTRWLLHTRDAHGLYRKLGFTEPDERVLVRPPLNRP